MIDNLQDLPDNERLQFLKDAAYKSEQTSYYRPLNEDDMNSKREELADNHIKLSELADEKKEMVDEFKGRMNPLINHNKSLLKDIKSRHEEVEGTLYYVPDMEAGVVETFDGNGLLINTRRIRPGEKFQQSIQFPNESRAI